MSAFAFDDPVLQQARTRAGAGAWSDVATLLAGQLAPAAERPERVTLYAEALIRSGAPQRARECLREAVPTLAATPHRHAHRTALNLLGAASFAMGALDEAQAAWDHALELAQQSDDPLLVARATNNLGAIANLRGASHDALYLYKLAVPVYQRLGELRGLAETFHNLAITHRDLGDLSQADEYERRAMEYAREARAERLLLMARAGRAELALRRGDNPLAAATAREVARVAGAAGDAATRADALRCAGEACTAMSLLDDARQLLDEAIALARDAGQALMQAESLLASARLAHLRGDRARAHDDAIGAARLFAALGARRELALAESVLASDG